jgi:peptidyl-prolyl cis-trans isomerase SurA
LRNLIDETLQIQEAAANDIRIDKAELQESFAGVAANFRQSPKDFAKYLASKGSSPASISRQIEAESLEQPAAPQGAAFRECQSGRGQRVIQKLNASKGSDEYHVGEIYLSAYTRK